MSDSQRCPYQLWLLIMNEISIFFSSKNSFFSIAIISRIWLCVRDKNGTLHFLERKINHCYSDKGLKRTVVNRTFLFINNFKTKKCREEDNSFIENSFPAFFIVTFDTLPIYSFLNDWRIFIKNCVNQP